MTKEQLKTKFKNGTIPDEDDFSDLIDTFVALSGETSDIITTGTLSAGGEISFNDITFVGTTEATSLSAMEFIQIRLSTGETRVIQLFDYV